MKLLIISPSFFPSTFYGGPSLSVYYLSRAFSVIVSPLKVVTTDANGNENLNITKNKFIEVEKNLPVKYYGNSTSYGLSLRMILNLWKDIKANEIIYVVSLFSPSTPEAIFFSALFKKKIILSPRGQLSDWAVASKKSILKNIWIKLFIKPYQTKIIWHATSESEQEDINAVFKNARIFVLPNGISIADYDIINVQQNFFSRYISEPDKKFIITSMGRIHKVKGFDILIGVIEKLISQGCSSYLFIAGEDNGDLNRLKEIVNKKNLTENIFFTGHLTNEDKISFLSDSNLFALASHSENFGLVYAEALACGVPIIASKNTPWQIVEEYSCGKWIENTAEDFTKAIKEMKDKITPEMKLRCSEMVEEHYSWPSIAKAMKNKFEEIYHGG